MKKKIISGLLLLATFVAGGVAFQVVPRLSHGNRTSFSHGDLKNGDWDKKELFMKMKGMHEGGEYKEWFENVDKEVTNIDNGITVDITSEDADTVTKIQEKYSEDDESKESDKVSKETKIEVIDNGIRMTITSDDPEMIEKIQGLGVDKEEHPCKDGFHHMMWGDEKTK